MLIYLRGLDLCQFELLTCCSVVCLPWGLFVAWWIGWNYLDLLYFCFDILLVGWLILTGGVLAYSSRFMF